MAQRAARGRRFRPQDRRHRHGAGRRHDADRGRARPHAAAAGCARDPDRSFARAAEPRGDHHRSAHAGRRRPGARHRLVRPDHHARSLLARPGDRGRPRRRGRRGGLPVGAADASASRRCRAPTTMSSSTPARCRMSRPTASRALRPAACWSRAGRRPRKADAVRDQLGNAGFSDIAVFTGTPPALDAETRARRRGLTAPRQLDVAGLKKLVLRGGMEALYFTGAHHLLRPLTAGVGAILTLHHVRPPRARRVPAEPAARSVAGVPRRRAPLAAPRAGRSRLARRDASPAHRARFPPPLRVPHVRRRLSRQSALRAADPEEIRRAVRALHPDQLSRPARRIVVAHAGSARSRAAIASRW